MNEAAPILPESNFIQLSELMLSLTTALDMTEGQPPEHCIRCCWIGMHIGEKIGLSESELHDLYFTLLLKDTGCSSNAARICELYLTDDQEFKRNFKTVGTSLSSVINFVINNTGKNKNWLTRISTTIDILKNGDNYAQELIETRCSRGADIARELRFNENVALGVHALDEHWDGSGRPDNLSAKNIPLNSRIALLSQVIDVFQFENDLTTALEEANLRSGTWFDPALVSAMNEIVKDEQFCYTLSAKNIIQKVMALAPAKARIEIDDDYLDCIVSAFGKIIDSKSPFTSGHSERVALFTELIACEMGIIEEERKWLKRAALLHDVGKLGVSNTILDKPGKLDDDEWLAVQKHAQFTKDILSQITPFKNMSDMAGSHHEKLDGTGYPNRLKADAILLHTRIITTADIFDAITAERPYRGAIPVPKTLEIMSESLNTAIDADCFAALKRALKKLPEELTAFKSAV
ncbi:metal-dependent phosphohydrolase [Psychromonas sp. psych-6C06]|uniref:HD-GYP domain-containing protein n=1 Tax=Psychromonas sp. psych-6C06 TaxID=2058089 RepID=UPI000C323444|nr:HD-GYP domain-containing protein [Psychromonas sp. psych-6C06]PKF63476.1 metal-dependent phosphohydrolase [Psychromonas sp. psych-6C06]